VSGLDEATALTSSEIRRRAVRGTVALVGRSTALRVIGLATNVVLARLLLPSEFGELAIGLTTLTLASLFVAGGLGAALLQRREPPRRSELEGVVTTQVILGVAIGVVIAAIAAPLGTTGLVTAIMVWSLPISALRTSSVVLTERQMQYGPIVVAEVLETAVYAVIAIVSVLLGAGVYGVAAAAVVRAVVGTGYMLAAVPDGLVRPRLNWSEVRPLLSFGAQFQAAAVIGVGRDEGLNVGLAALGSLSLLGFWGLAQRVLQIPFLLFEALWRVSFPALARLTDAGDDVKELLGRTSSSLSIGVGLVLVALAASAQDVVPLVFGEHWSPTATSVALPCLGLLLSGPVSVVSAGFLYANGDARTVLNAMIASSIVVIVVSLGIVAIDDVTWAPGVGLLLGSLVEAAFFLVAMRRHGVRGVGHKTAICAACGVLAAGCGWYAGRQIDDQVLGAMVAVAVSEVVYVGTLLAVGRDSLRNVVRLSKRALVRAT
jgi:O-antigen/teichoic acid export membrane protein